jgi:hypothetical protein
MERFIPLLANPMALSPALLQFGLAGILAAAAGLAWSGALRLSVVAVSFAPRRQLIAGR